MITNWFQPGLHIALAEDQNAQLLKQKQEMLLDRQNQLRRIAATGLSPNEFQCVADEQAAINHALEVLSKVWQKLHY